MVRELLDKLMDRTDLTGEEPLEFFKALLSPDVSDITKASLLTAMRCKGETSHELASCARHMRAIATPPGLSLQPEQISIDLVGTGGDHAGTHNISTGAALLTAACVPDQLTVIKHGNRAITSQSGSADVLAQLGLPMPMQPQLAAECLKASNFTFLFAPHYHTATAAVGPVRKALGVRTIFNLLGPLTNPAQTHCAVIGAYSFSAAELLAEAASLMNFKKALVVHTVPEFGPPLDEATPIAPFICYEVTPKNVMMHEIDSVDLGIPHCDPLALRGGDAAFNAQAIRKCLAGEPGALTDSLLLNAGLALWCSELTQSPLQGVEVAREAIQSGRAAALLQSIESFGKLAAATPMPA
jgi:anthranilate phosphoribosyltransferase